MGDWYGWSRSRRWKEVQEAVKWLAEMGQTGNGTYAGLSPKPKTLTDRVGGWLWSAFTAPKDEKQMAELWAQRESSRGTRRSPTNLVVTASTPLSRLVPVEIEELRKAFVGASAAPLTTTGGTIPTSQILVLLRALPSLKAYGWDMAYVDDKELAYSLRAVRSLHSGIHIADNVGWEQFLEVSCHDHPCLLVLMLTSRADMCHAERGGDASIVWTHLIEFPESLSTEQPIYDSFSASFRTPFVGLQWMTILFPCWSWYITEE